MTALISRRIRSALILMLMFLPLLGSAAPVQWSVKVTGQNTENPAVVITAQVASGYHLYAPSNPQPGGVPITFRFDNLKGAKLVGAPVANKKYTKAYNDIFEQDEHYFSGSVSFTQKLKPTAEKFQSTLRSTGRFATMAAASLCIMRPN